MFESFLTVEGADGIGKSTQIKLLTERVKKLNKSVRLFDFPSKSGNPIGELIGSFLVGEHKGVTPEFLSLAFAIDRRNLMMEFIKSEKNNTIGIADRFVLSNIAFQCAKLNSEPKRRSLAKLIEWVEYEVLELPHPTLELVLVAPHHYFKEGLHMERSGSTNREYSGGTADVHERAISLQSKVNEFYASLEDGEHLKKFNIFSHSGQRKTADELHSEIWKSVSSVLGLGRSRERPCS